MLSNYLTKNLSFFSQSSLTQIFNHALQFESKGNYSIFSIREPNVKILYPNILHFKSYSCLSIRSISSAQRFQKGMLWSKVQLNLKQTMDLIQCDFNKNIFTVNDPRKNTELVVNIAQSQEGIQFSIKNQGSFHDFILSSKDFFLLQKIITDAIPRVYGLEQSLQQSRNILLRQYMEGVIPEQQNSQQSDEQDFIL